MTNSIEELADANVIFVIGSNTTAAHPLVATRLYRARAKGAKIILADPRKIQLSLMSDLFVSQKLGTDVALINGIMHVIIKEGWHNKAFIEERTEGFAELEKTLENYPPEKVSAITGVSVDDIETIARWYSQAEKGSIVYCMGITQHTSGHRQCQIPGQPVHARPVNMGRESAQGVNPLRGQNNVQGACDMGGSAQCLSQATSRSETYPGSPKSKWRTPGACPAFPIKNRPQGHSGDDSPGLDSGEGQSLVYSG